MRSSGGAQVIIALSLVVLTLGPFVVGPAVQSVSDDSAVRSDAAPGQPNFLERTAGEEFESGGSVAEPVDRQVRVVAELRDDAELSNRVERKYAEVYTREGSRQLRGTIRLSEVRSLSQSPGIGAVSIEGAPTVQSQPVAPGVDAIHADRVHRNGVTGEEVTVGVIDSGFQLSHPQIAGHVTAYRSFDGADGAAHGTAVASVVADTAPKSELHLAAVGPSTTPAEYREAVEWLERSGADVIVDAGSYFGRTGQANSSIAAVAANASDEVVFVTSAGNYAQRHWAGDVETVDDRVEFADGATRNQLNDGQSLAGPVTVSLQWSGSGDYDLYLMREMPTGDVVMTRSTGRSAGPGGRERISTTLPKGQYYVTVRANGTNTSATHMELFASHRLEHRTTRGSLTAPATAEGVVTVGAYADGRVESFSSRGPTASGDRGVDFVAPDTIRAEGVETAGGTSFSAPYVAGTVALLAGERPELSPSQLRDVMILGATDVGPVGPDPAAGYGLINASASYEALVTATLPHEEKFRGVGNESAGSAGDDTEPVDLRWTPRQDTPGPGDPLRGWTAVMPEDDATEADS